MTPEPLQTFADSRKGLGFAEFTNRNPGPFLVLQIPPQAPVVHSAFRTLQPMTRSELEARHGAATVGYPIFVYSVEKAAGVNALRDWITVGRTQNNDIAIDHPNLSKLQAYFRKGPAGEVSIVDPGSTNGTFVAGTRLAKNEARPLLGGEAIAFGTKISGFFHTADTLYRKLFADDGAPAAGAPPSQ